MSHLWRTFYFLQSLRGRKVALSAVIAIPFILILRDQLSQEHAPSNQAAIAIATFLDAKISHPPINMIRAFWAATLYFFSSLLYAIFQPSILKPKDVWLNSLSASIIKYRQRIKNPRLSEAELTATMEKTYAEGTVNFMSHNTVAYVISLFLFLLSVYMSTLVMAHYISRVWDVCPIAFALDWYADNCSE